MRVIGSFAELARLSGPTLDDHHRPFVDELDVRLRQDAAADARVPEVIDVWFDSGAMPFAQHHHPFEHEREFEQRFPADFICEAQDQTRGWFYSLLAVSTLLGRPAPYRNVVCLGPDPRRATARRCRSPRATGRARGRCSTRYGADAFRWYFFTSKQPWDGYRFSIETIGEGVRLFLSSCGRRTTSTRSMRTPPPSSSRRRRRPAAARRRRATSTSTAGRCRARRPRRSCGRAPGRLRRDLCGARDRRARRRAVELVRAPLAPALLGWRGGGLSNAALVPFDGGQAARAVLPVHRGRDLRQPRRRAGERAPLRLPGGDRSGGPPLATSRWSRRWRWRARPCALGLGAAAKAKSRSASRWARRSWWRDGREREAIERLAEIVREELNVSARALRGGRRGARQLRGQAQLPHARTAVRQGHAARGSTRSRRSIRRGSPPRCATAGRRSGSRWAGASTSLSADDVILTMRAARGLQRRARGRARGRARPRDRRRPAPRRAARARSCMRFRTRARPPGLAVEDRIELLLDGDPALIEGRARAHARLHRRRDARGRARAAARARREPMGVDGLPLSERDGDRRPALTIALRRSD